MTRQQPENQKQPRPDAQPDPSQAEGERSPGQDAGTGQQDVKYTPSQAEGDRETVEKNIREKEKEGYFDKDQGQEAG